MKMVILSVLLVSTMMLAPSDAEARTEQILYKSPQGMKKSKFN